MTTIQVYLWGGGISSVTVYPSRYSDSEPGALMGNEIITGGLCGQWTEDKLNPDNCDLFWRDGPKVNCVNRGDETNQNFVNYWKLDNYLTRNVIEQKDAKQSSTLINHNRHKQLKRIENKVDKLVENINKYRQRFV